MLWIAAPIILAWLICSAAADTGTNWREATNPFDGWTLSEIKAHPGFHAFIVSDPLSRDTICPSQARVSGNPRSPYAFQWIGYIELSQEHKPWPEIVVFDSSGAGVTLTSPEICPLPYQWVPVWAIDAIDYLYQLGYYEGYP
jgi:hypothetical protein